MLTRNSGGLARSRIALGLALGGTALAALVYAWDLLRGQPIIVMGTAGIAGAACAVVACLAAIVLVSRGDTTSGHSIIEGLTLSIASTTLIVTILEGSLRTAHYGEREARFGRFLEIVALPHEEGSAGGVRYRLNSLAFRDDAFPIQRPKGELRVICLGDSSTFGYGVELDQSYPQVLERRLRASLGRPVQVVNAGQVSATSYQGRLLYERWADKLDAQWIVAAFGHNDRWLRPLPDSKGGTSKAIALLLQARTVILLRSVLSRWLPPRQESFVPRVGSAEYARNLEAIAREAAQHGAKAIFLSLPDNPVLAENVARARSSIAAGRFAEALLELQPITRVAALNPYPEGYDLLAEVAERMGRPKVAARARKDAFIRRNLAPRSRDEAAYSRSLLAAAEHSGATAVVIPPDRARGKLMDICHPTPAFHEEISGAIANAILAGSGAGRTR